MNRLLPLVRVISFCALSLAAALSSHGAGTVAVPNGTDISKLSLQPNTEYLLEPGAAVTQSAQIILPTGTSFNGNGTGTLTIAKNVTLAFDCIYPDAGVTHFKMITGSEATTLMAIGSKNGADGCFFTYNTTADGWGTCCLTVGRGTNFHVTNNTIGQCDNYLVYCIDDGLVCTDNEFHSSLGQYIVRLTNGGPNPQPKGAQILRNVFDQRANVRGTQAFGARYAENWTFSDNTVMGSIRIGEQITTDDPTSRCDGFTISNNTWIQTATDHSAHTGAIQIDGGSTGNVVGNTFQPQACLDSPVGVWTNNSILVGENTMLYDPGQAQKPIVPSSSQASSYKITAPSAVVVVPMATGNFDAMAYTTAAPGIQKVPLPSENLGAPKAVGYTLNGTWTHYANVDFGAGVTSWTAKLACENSSAGHNIEMHLDSSTGPLIGTLKVAGTGPALTNWYTYTSQSILVTGAAGVHDLYLVFSAPGTKSGVANLQSFTFSTSVASK